MATQTIEYLSCSRLCCGTLPADVIICLPTAIVLNGLSSVEASLTAERCYQTNCRTSYIYTLTVDDDQLEENITLSGAEISGIFCKNCFTDWVEDQIVEVEDNSFYRTWTPLYTASGSMTYTSVNTDFAQYLIKGELVNIIIRATGTTGGVASTSLIFTLPVPAAPLGATLYIPFSAFQSSTEYNAVVRIDSGTDKANIDLLGGANFGLGADRGFHGSFIYKRS